MSISDDIRERRPRYNFKVAFAHGKDVCRAGCNRCGGAGQGDTIPDACASIEHLSWCPIALEDACEEVAPPVQG